MMWERQRVELLVAVTGKFLMDSIQVELLSSNCRDGHSSLGLPKWVMISVSYSLQCDQ
jgi:hypothetical protein